MEKVTFNCCKELRIKFDDAEITLAASVTNISLEGKEVVIGQLTAMFEEIKKSII